MSNNAFFLAICGGIRQQKIDPKKRPALKAIFDRDLNISLAIIPGKTNTNTRQTDTENGMRSLACSCIGISPPLKRRMESAGPWSGPVLTNNFSK
jgi:hypothetical protein